MATLTESFINSAQRPLQLRKRPDLQARRHQYQGRCYWVVKDPIGLNYFRFHEEEYSILNWLDGLRSLQSIRDQFQSNFAPQRISLQELQQFVGMLHRSGLLISNNTGQGRQLRRRGDKKKRKELLGKLSNVFALRFRGIDPERILNALLPWFGWLFTPAALLVAMMFGLSALLLVFVQWQTFMAKLPSFEQFFAAENWLWMGITMACVKVLHEFGHGLSCKKFGGECHEMGVMLLVFTPCLYCNVSDSWMLPNKWQRVFIGAAGMYVELILASIATFLWWYSEPGMLNFICLSVMFICSVSTVVFNSNPLLRFDGYYILMDIMEIPNLRQKSSEVLKRWFQKTCLGLELQDNPFLPQKNKFWFGIYTIAAGIYRWVVVFGIIWFLNQVLKPYGLESVGRSIAIAGLIGMVAQPVIQTYKFFRTPGKATRMKPKRVLATSAIAAAIIGFVCFVPLPFHVDCAFEIQPQDAYQVRVIEPGFLVNWNKRPGDYVRQNEVIAQLKNLPLEMELVNNISTRDVSLVNLEQAKLTAAEDRKTERNLSTHEADFHKAEEQVRVTKSRFVNLNVLAKRDGYIIEPPDKVDQVKKVDEDQLSSWHGSPFSPQNSDAYYTENDLLCYVADPAKMEAVMIVDQADVELLNVGDDVEMMLDSARLNSIHGVIERISKTQIKEAPQSLAKQAGGSLDTLSDSSGKLRPVSTSYQTRVPIENSHVPLRVGYRGRAKIHLEWKSLGWRFARYLNKTFKFEF
jgi:putative peptide zinc metalloprotease protein